MENCECLWEKSLNKSIANNRQLQFYNLFQVSFINEKGSADIEMLKFLNIFEDGNEHYLSSMIDKRNGVFGNLSRAEETGLLWYFPLSREKYRFTVKPFLISTLNYNELSQNFQTKFDEIWHNQLVNEEKKELHNLEPNSITTEQNNLTDLDRFNSPDKINISPNFVLLLFQILSVEYTSLPMPQVIADSRNSKFESLFQPYKRTKKYIHTKNTNEGGWNVKALNP